VRDGAVVLRTARIQVVAAAVCAWSLDDAAWGRRLWRGSVRGRPA
jgi:hypothetical protein